MEVKVGDFATRVCKGPQGSPGQNHGQQTIFVEIGPLGSSEWIEESKLGDFYENAPDGQCPHQANNQSWYLYLPPLTAQDTPEEALAA